MPVELGSFDAIIGMDWLSKYHAVIVCDEKLIRFTFGNEILTIRGDGSNDRHESRLNVISCSKAQEYMSKGCHVFLANITSTKDEDKSEGKRLEDVPIVREFPKVFPKNFLKEYKRLANLKAENEKSEKSLQRADELPITKINYRIHKVTKEAIMIIERNNQPLTLKVYDKFVTKQLGLSKWIEVHALASKMKGKDYDTLLKSLRAKFDWLKNLAGRVGLPPLPELTAFALTPAGKKRKRALEILKEVFVKENVVVDGMHRNLIPPRGVVGSRGLIITEPEAGIFFYNGNFNLAFQRESEFHLATTPQLIRTQQDIQRNTPEAEEMYKKMEFTIEARDDAAEARKTV
ncbi:hypothetical protein Tco_0162249 [Tanacetum coccineum]